MQQTRYISSSDYMRVGVMQGEYVPLSARSARDEKNPSPQRFSCVRSGPEMRGGGEKSGKKFSYKEGKSVCFQIRKRRQTDRQELY